MNDLSLEFSIPANNQKIIEVYNKLRSKQLVVNKQYQRKLVWKKSHKINFIDTILKNFPFPEIYIAPSHMDDVALVLIDEIVDGQQRLTTIKDYIEGTDVFALESKSSLTLFSELSQAARNAFLNYEVSVRYLKNVTPTQVREIFQRINKTEYSLNAVERLNAQYGDSEYICFCKQLIGDELNISTVEYILPDDEKNEINEFFHGTDDDDSVVFSETDISRMYALQYVMSIVVTLDTGKYHSRSEKVNTYVEKYNESFPQADEIKTRLLKCIKFISSLEISRDSRWYKKANLFSLICELDKCDLNKVDPIKLSAHLNHFDSKAQLLESGKINQADALSADEVKYLNLAREAVNQKSSREFRGNFILSIIKKSEK